jgi:hypothetical protein
MENHQGSEAGLKMMSRPAMLKNVLRILLFAIVPSAPAYRLAGWRSSASL